MLIQVNSTIQRARDSLWLGWILQLFESMHPLSFKDSFVFKSAEAGNTPTRPHVTVHGLVLH